MRLISWCREVERLGFLVVRNTIGAALALFQVALCCIFRGRGSGFASKALTWMSRKPLRPGIMAFMCL